VAVEKDPVIRDAILDTLSELRSIGAGASAIEDGLNIELERNRKLVTSVNLSGDSLDTLPVSDPRIAQLHATALAIVALVRQGGHVANMSDIYCVECDFSGTDVSLSATSFDRTILRDADFSRAHLENASFDGADILGARFISTNLHSAKLTDFYDSEEKKGRLHTSPFVRVYPTAAECEPPDFTGADLSGTSCAKQISFGVFEDYGPEYSTSWSYDLKNANLNGADLSDIKLFVRFHLPTSVSRARLIDPAQHTVDTLVPFLLKDGDLLDNGKHHMNTTGGEESRAA
jgi:uncharacterized protein YjbI with pentapeptide repeats